jgi:ankyrin repeat protein
MVAENNIKQVEKILDKGININVTDKLGRTPLHYAAIRGYVKIAELLLDRGANVNAVDSSKQWTPLFYATFMGDQKMIELLMSRGADMTIKDTFNRTVDDYKKD